MESSGQDKRERQEIRDALVKMQDGLDDLNIALIGNPKYNVKGLIKEVSDNDAEAAGRHFQLKNRLNDHGERLKKLEDGNLKQIAIVGAAGTAVGALGTFFGKVGLLKFISLFK